MIGPDQSSDNVSRAFPYLSLPFVVLVGGGRGV